MKKILFSLFILIAFLSVQAGNVIGTQTPEETAKAKTALIASRVLLTEDQSAKINHILLEYYQNCDKLKSMNLTPQNMKLRTDVLKSNRDKSIEDKLTYDQRNKKSEIDAILK